MRHAWEIADGDVAGTPPVSPLVGLKAPTGTRSIRSSAPASKARREQYDRDRQYSDAEIQGLLEAADRSPSIVTSGARDLLYLAEATGARVGELVSLRWQDIDLDADPPAVTMCGQIVRADVPENERLADKRGGIAKTGLEWTPRVKSRLSYRTILLKASAVDTVKRRRERLEELIARNAAMSYDREYVFASVRGHGMPDPDSYKKSIRRALDQLGHPEMEGLHALRRHVSRRLGEAGLSRMDRESLMGHTVEVSERHYSTHGVPRRAPGALELRLGEPQPDDERRH